MQKGLFTVIVALVAALAACAPPAAPASPQASGPVGASEPTVPDRRLVIAVRGEPPSLAMKPLLPFSGSLTPPLRLFNATLDFLDEREVPHPYLAEALPRVNTDTWRVFPDGRMETTYRLRPNLAWQDGAPLSAEDFVFAWRVYSTPDFGLATSPPMGQMEEVVAPDARTIRIRWRVLFADAGVLEGTYQPLPRHLLLELLGRADPVAFANLPFWTDEYVGLGPYRVTRWEPGAFIEAEGFDGHALGRPKIGTIKLAFIADANTALANLLAGEVHFVGDFIFSSTEGAVLEREWAANQGGTVLWAPTLLRLTVIQLRPAAADPPALVDVRVRRALAHAIDSATAADLLNEGKAVVTHTLTSPRVEYYPEIERAITKYPYDPRRAQQVLEEAGFMRGADGFYVGRNGEPFRPGVWSSSGPKNEQENAVFVDSLRQAGIDASRQIFPAAQLRDAEARALIPGLSTRGHGTNRLDSYTSEQVPRPENRWKGDNRGGWANPEYDRFFQIYTTTLERPERIKAIAQMERAFTEDVPAIAHFFGVTVTAHLAALKGPVVRHTPDAGFGFLGAYQWKWRS
jgi:peptide/nickel transport system substrate-binding protein